jgi:hypothetical protein
MLYTQLTIIVIQKCNQSRRKLYHHLLEYDFVTVNRGADSDSQVGVIIMASAASLKKIFADGG